MMGIGIPKSHGGAERGSTELAEVSAAPCRPPHGAARVRSAPPCDWMRCIPLLLLFSVIGCRETPAPKPYSGPTDPIDKVISDINANNARIPTLRSHLYFEGDIVDDKGNSQPINANGIVLYRRDKDLRLQAGKVSTGDVFDMGSNGQTYWLKVPYLDTFYWGKFANIGKPCVKKMPIRPDLILDVLGVGTIETDLLKKPFPIMRFNNDARAYMLDWVAPTLDGDRYIVQKEVWYDLESKHPGLVLLYDPAGRVVLRARLSAFKPLATDGGNGAKPPMVATSFQLYFPDSGSKMSFTLSDPSLSESGLPNDHSFHMPDPQAPGVGKTIQIDADCDGGGVAASINHAP
jgi:hypothetical protein